MAIMLFKVIYGHQFLHQFSREPINDILLVNNTNLHPASRRSQLVKIIGQIFTFDRRYLSWSQLCELNS